MAQLLANLDAVPIRLLPGNGPAIHHFCGIHEPFSAATHLLGAIVFCYLGFALIRRGGRDPRRRALLGVYALACVVQLFLSGCYHATTSGSALNGVMLRLDHAAIYILIAGTFTPIHGILFRGWLRWAPLLLLWGIAAGGVVIKIAYFGAMSASFSVSLYLAMGWFGLLCGSILWKQRGFACIRPLLLGGICYSAGAILDFCHWPIVVPGVIHAHDLFHVAVLLGMAFHFTFIWRIALPTCGPGDATASDDLTPFEFAPPVLALRP